MSSGGTPNTNVKSSLSNSFSEDIGYGGETDGHCSGTGRHPRFCIYPKY